ncbi:MAG: uroporphyrinogen decarboxylase family protein [Promethearchaeota archaeon]
MEKEIKHRYGCGYNHKAPSGIIEHSKYGPQMEKAFESNFLNKIFNKIIKVATNDLFLSVLNKSRGKFSSKIIKSFIDSLFINLTNKSFKSPEEKARAFLAFFGKNNYSKYKSLIGGYIIELGKKYISDWDYRQNNAIKIKPPIRKLSKVKKTYRGWKYLRDEIQPKWKIFPENPEKEIIRIFENDQIDPKDRILNLIAGKNADRVGFGPQFDWATGFFGGSNLWKFCYDGIETGWAQLNVWIRAGGMDFLPDGFGLAAYTVPYPDAHSRFFYKWSYPTDSIVPQFIEKELLKTYEDLYDYGMTGMLQQITKRMIRDTILLIRELIYLSKINSYYFGPYTDKFLPYSQLIFAIWDILPMWRGMIPFMRDMKKHPQKVIEAFEFLNKPYTKIMIGLGKLIKAKTALIGNSRGSNSWISPKLFKKIYWPSMKYTIKELLKNNIIPVCHLDNNWTENMAIFAEELPKRSCLFHLDQVDLVEVNKIIDGRFCLMGGMSPGLLVYGTPAKVEEETTRYIKNIKENGLIIASGCEYPADIPAQNLYAQKRAIKKYGFF